MVDGRGCGGRGWREGSAIKSTFQFLLNESFSLLFLYFLRALCMLGECSATEPRPQPMV